MIVAAKGESFDDFKAQFGEDERAFAYIRLQVRDCFSCLNIPLALIDLLRYLSLNSLILLRNLMFSFFSLMVVCICLDAVFTNALSINTKDFVVIFA